MRRLAPYAAFLAVLSLVPAVFTRVPFYTMASGVVMGLTALAALGLVPLTGYAGQVSLGQGAFYATGAYTSAVLTQRYGVNAAVALLAGAVLAGAAAWLLGLFLFRVQGHYLALATLAFGLAVAHLANQLSFTGGPNGVPGVPALAPFGHRLRGDVDVYALVAGLLLVAVLAVGWLLAAPLGRALTAVGDAPVAAAAAGVGIARLRRLAFTLAAVLASVAGSVYAHWSGFVDPSTAGLLNSIQLLIIATVGGLRTVWGAPVGAFAVVSLSQAAKEYVPRMLPHAGGDYEIVVYGVALVLVLLFLPDGVAGGARRLLRRRPAG
ncbi:MAG: branched-chain amino acid ABC transporter permease [Mycobacteriales bacterium]